ncbi:hypothetical protein GCM10010274_05810 [Streptomyces lavendofoliae]|uniref:Uncharacterized protein n=1 Tax=Streptomyces lavendofoliae TaxID=67314 RepID=A0A918HTL0_9ACTN|nr:hypothetical protein GCM10010274_05810 [Streptomyces lavendofoliae]
MPATDGITPLMAVIEARITSPHRLPPPPPLPGARIPEEPILRTELPGSCPMRTHSWALAALRVHFTRLGGWERRSAGVPAPSLHTARLSITVPGLK